MEGYKLKYVDTLSDLEDVNMAWLLGNYSIDDCTGVYYDEEEAEFDTSKMKKTVVQIGVVVHGRLYIENADVWVGEEGVFIEHEEFHSHF